MNHFPLFAGVSDLPQLLCNWAYQCAVAGPEPWPVKTTAGIYTRLGFNWQCWKSALDLFVWILLFLFVNQLPLLILVYVVLGLCTLPTCTFSTPPRRLVGPSTTGPRTVWGHNIAGGGDEEDHAGVSGACPLWALHCDAHWPGAQRGDQKSDQYLSPRMREWNLSQ